MPLGRCSRRGPAEAVTPAIIPSAASAPAKACAVGASSFARLAATNTVTPELGESGMPAGGSPTARPDGATLTQFAARSALSRSSHNGRASSDPGTTWPSNSWPANFCSAAATRRWPSAVSVRGVFNFASSSSASRARSRASERSALLPKRATPRPTSTTAMKSKASPFCRRRLQSKKRVTATAPIKPIANNAYPQSRQNSGPAIPRRRSLMRASFSRGCSNHLTAHAVRSPPPCGEGLGVGVARFLRRWRHRYLTASPPSPALPQPAAGLPASGQYKSDQTPASRGLVGGREQTSARGGGSSRSLAGAAEGARRARRVARQHQKAVPLREQQRADVELGEEHAAFDQARDLRGRDEFHADARLGLERACALAGLDEEIVDAVVEASGAGGVLAERMNGAGGEPGLFQELAPAAVGRVFAGVDEARRQLPGECFERRPV